MNFSVVRTPLVVVSAAFTFLLFLSERGWGQSTELESLRALVKGMEQQLQQALQRIDQLEKEKGSTSVRVEQVEKSIQAVQSAPTALNPAITPIQPLVPELCQRNSSYFTALTSIHRWRPETKSTPVEASSQLRADSLNLTSLNS